MTVGCRPSLSTAWMKAQPLGAQSHLWQLPTYQSAPIVLRLRSIWPGAWAPSIRTFTPAWWQAATISAAGISRALAEVMWSRTSSFVDGVRHAVMAAMTESGVGLG